MEFRAWPDPAAADLIRLAARYPANPFATDAFATARTAAGAQAWILVVQERGELVDGCFGFVTSGILSRTLDIHSLPGTDAPQFWTGLDGLCRTQRVTSLLLNSFGSCRSVIPQHWPEMQRRKRTEFVLRFRDGEVQGKLATNHRRNINAGRKHGLEVRVASDPDACVEHVRLMKESMARRSARGESIGGGAGITAIERYTASGAGRIYQAVQDGEVLSSILVLSARSAGYYHSAGTSPRGMDVGASHFLIYSIAERMANAGFESFNLGGAEGEGLQRFKLGFGTTAVELEAATCAFTSGWRSTLARSVRALHLAPSRS